MKELEITGNIKTKESLADILVERILTRDYEKIRNNIMDNRYHYNMYYGYENSVSISPDLGEYSSLNRQIMQPLSFHYLMPLSTEGINKLAQEILSRFSVDNILTDYLNKASSHDTYLEKYHALLDKYGQQPSSLHAVAMISRNNLPMLDYLIQMYLDVDSAMMEESIKSDNIVIQHYLVDSGFDCRSLAMDEKFEDAIASIQKYQNTLNLHAQLSEDLSHKKEGKFRKI